MELVLLTVGVAMPSTSKKFTDHNLKQLYGNLLTHYEQCVYQQEIYATREYNTYLTYNKMFLAVQYALDYGSLQHLDFREKQKVYEAFNAIFCSLPLYRGLSQEQKSSFNPQPPKSLPKAAYVLNHYNNYNCYDTTRFNWLLLRTIAHNCHHYPPHLHGACTLDRGVNQHKQIEDNAVKEGISDLMAILILIALAASAAVLTMLALYYMFNQFLNSAERFYYNEGCLKAALMLASSFVFGATSMVMTFTMGSPALIFLAIIAGINPASVVITGAILLSIMGSGLGCFAMNMFYDFVDKRVNKHAMDPTDPLRFRLSAEDELNLMDLGLDPIKVKCALVALRAEIANVLGHEGSVPSFLNRMFGEGAKVQGLLQLVRQLRSGSICYVEVGHLVFDCRKNQQLAIAQQPVYQYYIQQMPAYNIPHDPIGNPYTPIGVVNEVNPSPTAPPMDEIPPLYPLDQPLPNFDNGQWPGYPKL